MQAYYLASFFMRQATAATSAAPRPEPSSALSSLIPLPLRKHALNHSSTLLLIILCTWNQLINGFFHDACKVGMILKEGTVDCNDSVSCRPNFIRDCNNAGAGESSRARRDGTAHVQDQIAIVWRNDRATHRLRCRRCRRGARRCRGDCRRCGYRGKSEIGKNFFRLRMICIGTV